MNIVFLAGARNNSGDYLIVDRARKLFRKYLPEAKHIVIDRTREIDEKSFRLMDESDLVVLVGGPLVRRDCAEALNLANAINSGWLEEIKTPFVIMGGGAKLPEPFSCGSLQFTGASRRLFEKLEASCYFSGTRDVETLVLLRNAGFTNFKFTGCPAIYSESDVGSGVFVGKDVKRIVFSLGAPGQMSDDDMRQHKDVAHMLKLTFPTAEVVVAAHHASNPLEYVRAYNGVPPNLWFELIEYFRRSGFKVIDISGRLESMLNLYSSADLHVGYRVHAHILMTSWKKASVLIAEDGRGSGMSDVISGRVFCAWRYDRKQELGFIRVFRKKERFSKIYDLNLAEKIKSYLVSIDGEVPNVLKFNRCVMQDWFAQFKEPKI